MKTNCSSCGGPLPATGIVASVMCGYCGGTNWNEDFVRGHLSSVNVARASSRVRMGKASYEGGNFKEAAEQFKGALEEDATQAVVWAWRGLSLARCISVSNLGSLPREVGACFRAATDLAPGDEFVVASQHLAQEAIVGGLHGVAQRSYEEAQKVLFAFSDDPPTATTRSAPLFARALTACEACLDSPSQAIQQMLEICRIVVLISHRPAVHGVSRVREKADAYVESIRKQHPSIVITMPSRPVRSAACFPGHVSVSTPSGSRRISELRAGDEVLSFDPGTRQVSTREVIRVLEHAPAPAVEVCFEASCLRLAVTRGHLVLAARGWVEVRHLRPGDCLLRLDGRGQVVTCRVAAIVPLGREEPLYNLRTTGEHSFMVEGVPSHNFARFRSARGKVLELTGFARRAWRLTAAGPSEAWKALRRVLAAGRRPASSSAGGTPPSAHPRSERSSWMSTLGPQTWADSSSTTTGR